MRLASNNLQTVIHKNKRSLVLLAACGELHGYTIKGSLWACGCGIAAACVWFICVAFRAGVLT